MAYPYGFWSFAPMRDAVFAQKVCIQKLGTPLRKQKEPRPHVGPALSLVDMYPVQLTCCLYADKEELRGSTAITAVSPRYCLQKQGKLDGRCRRIAHASCGAHVHERETCVVATGVCAEHDNNMHPSCRPHVSSPNSK